MVTLSHSAPVRVDALLAEIALLAAQSAFRLKRLDALVFQSAGSGDASALQTRIRQDIVDESAAMGERGRLVGLCATALP